MIEKLYGGPYYSGDIIMCPTWCITWGTTHVTFCCNLVVRPSTFPLEFSPQRAVKPWSYYGTGFSTNRKTDSHYAKSLQLGVGNAKYCSFTRWYHHEMLNWCSFSASVKFFHFLFEQHKTWSATKSITSALRTDCHSIAGSHSILLIFPSRFALWTLS